MDTSPARRRRQDAIYAITSVTCKMRARLDVRCSSPPSSRHVRTVVMISAPPRRVVGSISC